MTVRIEETIYKNRFNLVDDELSGNDRYLRQFSIKELIQLEEDINFAQDKEVEQK